MVLTTTRRIGWDEYLQLPLTHYEIIDGEVNTLPTPLFKHQQIVLELMIRLGAQVQREAKGYLVPAPFDVVIRRAPLRTRQPDLLFLSRERADQIPDLQNQPRIEIASVGVFTDDQPIRSAVMGETAVAPAMLFG